MYGSKSGTTQLVEVLIHILVRSVASDEGAVNQSVGSTKLG
jgi:hypothetical protein